MIVPSRLAATHFTLIMLLMHFQPALAQELGQSPTSQTTPAPQKEPQRGQTERQETQPDPEQEIYQAIRHLTGEINLLGAEVQRLRKVTERNAQTLELLLNEERLSKVEDKIQALTDQRSQLDAREQEIQRRMRNIPAEMLVRGSTTLKREEIEAAIKADLQRALDDVRNQQSGSQTRLAELTGQAERLRLRITMLRERVDQTDSKSEKPDQ